MQAAASGTARPRMVVFDLDNTVWTPELYEMDGSPYRKDKQGNVVDRRGTTIAMFPAAEAVLRELRTWDDVVVAAASRTEYPEWADEVLRLMTIDGTPLHDIFSLQEIYPSSKRRHFKKLTEDSGIPYSDMLFFDDMMMNISEISRLGVTCAYCPYGMTQEVWEEGLASFARSKA